MSTLFVPFTTKLVIDDIMEYNFNGIPYSYIAAQFLHESNYGRSRLFQEQNNLFGMRCPKIRQTTQIACENDYGTYSDIRSCIVDFDLYLKYFRKLSPISLPITLEDYIAWLKSNKYFEDSYENYLKGCEIALYRMQNNLIQYV